MCTMKCEVCLCGGTYISTVSFCKIFYGAVDYVKLYYGNVQAFLVYLITVVMIT